MIDTDKYEGHTPGRWTVFVDDGDGDFDRPILNQRLAADAPLLLAEVKRLKSLIRTKGLCINCGESHEEIEVVMDYSYDEVGHRLSKECSDTCHPQGATCCDLCLCLNGFTIEHDYWEEK